MKSQNHNFRINPENFHPCLSYAVVFFLGSVKFDL